MQKYTRNEWRRCTNTLETSGDDLKLHLKRVEKIGIIRSNEHNNLKFHDLRENFKNEICKVQQLLQSSPLETSVFQSSPPETSVIQSSPPATSVIQSSPPEMSVIQTTSTQTRMSVRKPEVRPL